MTNKSPSNVVLDRGHQPRMANDGHQPRPAAPAAVSVPTKVQGGYQAPSGGNKPATPTTGSGVKK